MRVALSSCRLFEWGRDQFLEFFMSHLVFPVREDGTPLVGGMSLSSFEHTLRNILGGVLNSIPAGGSVNVPGTPTRLTEETGVAVSVPALRVPSEFGVQSSMGSVHSASSGRGRVRGVRKPGKCN